MNAQPPGQLSPPQLHRGTRARAAAFAVATIVICAIMLSASMGIMPAKAGPDTDEILSIVENVDDSNLRSTIEELEGFGSRSFVLENSSESALYIYERFVDIGLETEIQEFTVGDITSSNIIATIPTDSGSEGLFLFGAHYDSENRLADTLTDTELLPAPGADDDASGIAAIIEIARILSDVDLHNTVKFVAFGAEEYGYDHSGGCVGSAHFVEQEVANGKKYEGSAILDMIGYKAGTNNIMTIITNEESNRMADATKYLAEQLDLDLTVDIVNSPWTVYSDHSSFWEEDYRSMLVTEEADMRATDPPVYVPINPYYHTSQDTVDTLSLEQIEVISQALLGGILWLSAEDANNTTLLLGIVIITMASIVVTISFVIARKRRR